MTIRGTQSDRKIEMNKDWTFCWAGDVNHPRADISDVYKINYNDSEWRKLNLPHDWSIEFDFNIEHSLVGSEAGYLDGGTGWYRKKLVLPQEMKDKRIAIHFGGVYMDSTVYVNEKQVGKYPNGYMPFTYDLTDYIIADGTTENVIAVKVVNEQPSSRWYSGSGIYRDVELIVTESVHVVEYGTFVTTPFIEEEYATGKVTMHIQTEVKNTSESDKQVVVRSTLLDYKTNEVVAQAVESEVYTIASSQIDKVDQQMVVSEPKLWSTAEPNLYTMLTEVIVEGEVVDTYKTRCGFRWIKFDAKEGFFLNGEWMKLKGVCMHHDQGALGAVANTRAIERQMEIMQDMGANAIRVTHNPAADELLRICDEKGLLVIDEAFDTWYGGKKQYDLGRFFSQGSTSHPDGANTVTWAEFDLKRMVKRGRNFPCIIKWSVGNEVSEASGDERSLETIKNMKKWVYEVDPTRGITQGADKFRFGTGEGGHEDIAAVQDTVGFNYAEENYDSIHAKHPDWVIYGSETSSATKSRGVYSHPDWLGSHDSGDHSDYQQSSYDNDHVGWGKTATNSWIPDRDRKYIAGQFIWTGFDYIGEPTPWHNTGGPGHELSPKSSYFGIVDTAGFPKDDYYLYQSVWKCVSEAPMVHILPHWNWEDDTLRSHVTGEDGKIPLRVYSNAPRIELFIDGVSQGEKIFAQKVTDYGFVYQQQSETSDRLYLEWRLDYEYRPGTKIQAVAKSAEGIVIAEETIVTADKAAQVALQADRSVIHADGKDLCYITVDIQDEKGNFVPTADNEVQFEIIGQGQIVGVDNGNPVSHERYKAQADGTWKRKVFNGKAVVIVQATEEGGSFTLKASSKGLEGAYVTAYTVEDTRKTSREVLGYEVYPIKTEVGVMPTLPENVIAVLADGTKVNQAITWSELSKQQLNQMGVVTVQGTVNGVEATVSVEVVVVDIRQGEKASVAELTSLTINNKEVAGFNPNTFIYEMKVPYGEQITHITAVAKDNAKICIVPPSSYTGVVIVEVEADEHIKQRYIVHIDEAMPQLKEVNFKVEHKLIKEDEKVGFILEGIKEDGIAIDLSKAEVYYHVKAEDKAYIEFVQNEIYAYTAGTLKVAVEVIYGGISLTSDEVTLTIVPNEVVKEVVAYEEVQIGCTVGNSPNLPKMVKAYFNVGFPRMVEVEWSELSETDYNTYGQFEVEGKVKGYALLAKAIVVVKGILAIESVSVAAVKGIPAELPEKVMVYYSDHTKAESHVRWNETRVNYSAVGIVEVTGMLEDVRMPVTASVRITEVAEEIKESKNYAKQWTGSQFPAALASFTNDVEGSKDNISHVNDTVIAFDEMQHNRWSNWQHAPRDKEWVGILFAEGGNITKRYMDTVKVGFFEDHGVGAPENFTIEYYVPDREPAAPHRFGHVIDGELAEEGNWKPVMGIQGDTAGVEAGSMHDFTFEPVHTYAIRLNMTRKADKQGIAITELEAYGKEAIAYEDYEIVEVLVDGCNVLDNFDEALNCVYMVQGNLVPEVRVNATKHAKVTVIPAVDRNGITQIEVLPENGDVTKTKIYHISFK